MLKSALAVLLSLSMATSMTTAALAQEKLTPVMDETLNVERRISPGDTLTIDVSPAREYSREALVQPDGTIEMLMIGAVHLAGLTAEEARSLLAAKLSVFVSHPKVNVSTRFFSSRFVIIAGEVYQAGTYEYKDDMRVMDLILKAGGPKDWARLKSVKIFRKEGGKTQRLVIDFQKVLDGNFAQNLQLQPLDMVYVQTKPFNKTARWLNDNIIPWITLFTFGITLALVARNPR